MRTNRVLVIEPAQSYERLQGGKEFFVENLDELLHEQHRAILEDLMRYERQCFLNAHPHQRHDGRVDQANGFYQRHLTTRSGTFELQVPRTRRRLFHSQVIPRHKRRDKAVDEAIKSVFLLGVSTRQTGRALELTIGPGMSHLDKIMKSTRRRFIQNTGILFAGATFSASLSTAQDQPKKRALQKAIMYETIGQKGSVLEKFRAMKAAGFEGVEAMSHMKQDEVLKAYEETGLKCASVCCSTHWNKTLSHPDDKMRAEGLEGLKQALRDAKRYGGNSVLLVPGVARNGVTYQQCWDRSIAEIRKAIPLAEELGVKIAIENVWNDFITTPEAAKRYLDEINSPHVGWHFDIGNMIKYNPPETWIPVLGKRILKLHIKEYSKTKGFGVKFFEGDNNWPAIMRELDKIGYAGWAITEQPGEQTRDAEALKDFTARLDRVLAS
jgi:L-ribulose-5-phosphate 3-epimerase